jgi:hypothetical protein
MDIVSGNVMFEFCVCAIVNGNTQSQYPSTSLSNFNQGNSLIGKLVKTFLALGSWTSTGRACEELAKLAMAGN